MPLKEGSSDSTAFSPEKLLIDLFSQATFKYPANSSGQGIWLTILFREWQEAGKIPDKLSLYALKRGLDVETKNVVLQAIVNAAHQAYKPLADKPAVSPAIIEDIMTAALQTKMWCQVFERRQLDALLEMLPIYMQVGAYVSGNAAADIQNPELTKRKALIKECAQGAFDGDFQRIVIESIDEVLFTRMPCWNTYIDARFGIFVMWLSLLFQKTRRGSA